MDGLGVYRAICETSYNPNECTEYRHLLEVYAYGSFDSFFTPFDSFVSQSDIPSAE